MEAKEGHGGSYAWKSNLKGWQVIRQGAKWRVGNGEDVKIWGDNWLPSVTSTRVHGPLISKFQEATVSSLINPLSRSWETHLLYIALSPTEAELVKKIPLSCEQEDDKLYWPCVQSGEYSVKPRYFFLKTETSNNSSSIQILQGTTKPLWKQIWQLAVPSKIIKKIYGEQPDRNALPTNVNLVRRCAMC